MQACVQPTHLPLDALDFRLAFGRLDEARAPQRELGLCRLCRQHLLLLRKPLRTLLGRVDRQRCTRRRERR